MALIVEDGTGKDDAESYLTAAEARAILAKRGQTLPADDAEAEPLLVRAMDYIETLEPRFKGTRTSTTQALAWPREDVTVNGVALGSDAIPSQLKQAQARLAFDAQTLDLMPTSSGRAVKRQKVDVIETEYEDSGGSAVAQPQLTAAMAFLDPLFETGSSGATIDLIRV